MLFPGKEIIGSVGLDVLFNRIGLAMISIPRDVDESGSVASMGQGG